MGLWIAIATGLLTLHSYQIFFALHRLQKWTQISSPAFKWMGSYNKNYWEQFRIVSSKLYTFQIHQKFEPIICTFKGKNIGNQLIIPGLWVLGSILSITSSYKTASKYPENPCSIEFCWTLNFLISYLELSIMLSEMI